MGRYDVTPNPKGGDANYPWVVKRSGRRVSRHKTQQNAINAARKKGNKGDQLYVHGHDGRIRTEYTLSK